VLERLEQQTKLTANQWKIMIAAILGDMLDFFDYFLIGYVLAFIVHDWNLTYGQSAMILLAAGVGAVPGAYFWGWIADKIGRRKAFIGTALNFSIATGIMAFTPDRDWIFLTIFRFFVGFGVSGLFAVDTTLVQEYVPASKRGWVGGIVTSCLPLGLTLGAVLGRFLTPYVGWRGLFAVGLLPALLTLLIRSWVPESPRWLMRMGRFEEARQSLAWTLQVDPKQIELPAATAIAPNVQTTKWRQVFSHPRSLVLSILINLSQTGGNGLLLWATTLFVLILNVTPAEAAGLMIWVSLCGFLGRLVFSYLSDAIGRRPCGMIIGFFGALLMALAGYLHDVFIGGVSLFYLLIVAQRFFGDASYAIIGPYSAEVWPASLRASGMGVGYGTGNIGKVIGPLGLAVIVGTSNYVHPQATLDAIVPALLYLAFWYGQAGVAFWLLGFETRGRSIEEIDDAFARPERFQLGANRQTALPIS
jgi:MFS transporter, putative metabolite:H+ symporter